MSLFFRPSKCLALNDLNLKPCSDCRTIFSSLTICNRMWKNGILSDFVRAKKHVLNRFFVPPSYEGKKWIFLKIINYFTKGLTQVIVQHNAPSFKSWRGTLLRLVATGFQIRTLIAKKTMHASILPFFSSFILGYLIKQIPDKTPADLFTPSWMTILRTIDGQKHIYHNITVLPRWSYMEVVLEKHILFFCTDCCANIFLFRFYVLISSGRPINRLVV